MQFLANSYCSSYYTMCPCPGKSFGLRAALHKEGSQFLIDLRFQSLANPHELKILIVQTLYALIFTAYNI